MLLITKEVEVEMKNKLTFIIDELDDKMRLNLYLKEKQKLSSRFIKSAAIEKRIEVDGKKVKLNYVVKTGEKVEIDVEKEETQDMEPQKLDSLEIAYEDSDIIVVNKPPNIVVHPTKSHPDKTLANGLLYYFKEKGENSIVRLVSRLDMDTSGLILVAKNQFSHMSLARDMNLESFEKGYVAVVHGNLQNKSGTIDKPIYRTGGDSIRRIIDERGQRSITHYEVVESYAKGDLVRLHLETGRTHQIRVHLCSIGHPIFGDLLYDGKDDLIKRQALHAYKLHFPHPKTGEIIKLETKLPDDIKNLIYNIK